MAEVSGSVATSATYPSDPPSLFMGSGRPRILRPARHEARTNNAP